jgi:hypothetical protein
MVPFRILPVNTIKINFPEHLMTIDAPFSSVLETAANQRSSRVDKEIWKNGIRCTV